MLSMFRENKVNTTKIGFMTMSSSPQRMPMEQLSALLKNKPAYVKHDNRVYFVDQHAKPLSLSTEHFARLSLLFPVSIDVLREALEADLVAIKQFTGHTMSFFLVLHARHTCDVRDSRAKRVSSQSQFCTDRSDVGAFYNAIKDEAMEELDTTGNVLQLFITGTLSGKNVAECFNHWDDADLFMQRHQLLPSPGACCVM